MKGLNKREVEKLREGAVVDAETAGETVCLACCARDRADSDPERAAN